MIIERTEEEVIFKFPSDLNLDDLQDLADLFNFREVAKKSKATQQDVNQLVKNIKKGRWEKTKQQLDL